MTGTEPYVGSADNSLVAVAQYVEHITAAWRRSVEGVLEAGDLLRKAKAELAHGDWLQIFGQKRLPFGERTAQMLMAIAADQRLRNPNRGSFLPPHWRTMYELTRLSDEALDARFEDGTIRPEMERRDIATEVKKERRAQREQKLAETQLKAPEGKFGVIVEDYEWDHVTYSDKGRDRHAENHYPVSRDAHSAQEIVERTKERFACAADDCVCFSWSTLQHAAIAMDVLRMRGFEYKSQYAWGKDKIGLGYWSREKHEILLIGVRGDIPCPAPGAQWESLIMAPRGQHSAKPECFLEMIEQYFPNLPKIELNRRGPARKGWSAWGNETGEQFDPETGEIIEPAASSTAVRSSGGPKNEEDREPPHPRACAGSPFSPDDELLDIPVFLRRIQQSSQAHS